MNFVKLPNVRGHLHHFSHFLLVSSVKLHAENVLF